MPSNLPIMLGQARRPHVSDAEMKEVMKAAVNGLYRLFWQRDHDPAAYYEGTRFGARQTAGWSEPAVQAD